MKESERSTWPSDVAQQAFGMAEGLINLPDSTTRMR
jgi:hypothetical protein